MLDRTNKFANFFEVEIPVVIHRKFFLDKESYLQNHPPKPMREIKKERAELAQQLGVSRAWVTKVLRDLKAI